MHAARQPLVQRPVTSRRPICRRKPLAVRATSFDVATSGIIIRRGLSLEQAKNEGFTKWPTWSSGVSKFPWTYSEQETCYILEGKVIVTPEGTENGVSIGPGDFVTFQEGLSCTWDVQEAVKKHYNFG